MNSTFKSSISPFVAIAFAVIAATGALLFFHVKNGPIMVLHEWFGWAFIAAGLSHLLLNWRSLLSYLRLRSGRMSLTVAVVLTIGLTLAGLTHNERGRHGAEGERPPVAQE